MVQIPSQDEKDSFSDYFLKASLNFAVCCLLVFPIFLNNAMPARPIPEGTCFSLGDYSTKGASSFK